MNVTGRNEWKVDASKIAKCSEIPVLESLNTWMPNENKSVIILASEFPTENDILKAPQQTIYAMQNTIRIGKNNGYAPSVGYDYSRNAVVELMSRKGIELAAKDVILCSGCSSALDLCITVLADGKNGQNILIPKPGFYVYKMLAKSLGIEVKEYDLLPNDDWNINLFDLNRKIDANTAAVIVSNPSNPCGSVYSSKHLLDVLEICERYKLPVIADESNDQLVYNTSFISIGSLETSVPILICGGLSKEMLVPGWRLGWIAICDSIGAFENIRKGLISLTQRIIGCNTVVQGALPSILNNNSDFIDQLHANLRKHATITYDAFQVDGLKPRMPQAALHMLVEIDMRKFNLIDTMDFVKKLYEEESVKCLPSEIFGVSGYMRISIANPIEHIIEASERVKHFCNKYYK